MEQMWFSQQNGQQIPILSGNTCQSKATTSQQPSNKTTTMSSVKDVNGLLQVTESQLVNSFGLYTKALIMSDTAYTRSWVADSLDLRN